MSIGSIRTRIFNPWFLAGLSGVMLAISIVSWKEGDPDFWWHIADGKWILAHHSLPYYSPWLFGAALGHHWTLAEYGSEIWMYLAGQTGVILITAAAFAGVCALAAYRARLLGSKSAFAIMLAPILVSLIGWAEIAPRDQMATTLGVAVIALICELQLMGRRVHFWMLPPMFLLWVNLHPGFIGGMGLWGLAILVWTIQGVRSGQAPVDLKRNYLWWGVSFVATLINPYTYHIWIYAIKTLAGGGAAFIQEWQSPNFHWISFWPVLILVLALPVAWPKLSPMAKTWALMMVAAALVSGRNVELLGAIMAAPLAVAWTSRLSPSPKKMTTLFAMTSIIAAAFCGITLYTGVHSRITNKLEPVTLVSHLQRTAPEGARIFPPYAAAGYILYHLPQDKVWLYGDNALIGAKLMSTYASIDDLAPSWASELRQTNANLVITSNSEPLQQALLVIPACRVLYKGQGWAAFTGTTGGNCPIAPLAH